MGVAVEKYKPRSLGSVAALTRSGRKLHQAVGKKEGQALALAIGCGYHLFALKVETAQNGDWGRVCEQVAGSPRTARTYMQIALGFRQSPAEIEAAGTRSSCPRTSPRNPKTTSTGATRSEGYEPSWSRNARS